MAESAVQIRCTKPQLRLFIPWSAGTSRHERLVRKHVPGSDTGWTVPATRCVIPAPPLVILAKAGIQGRGCRWHQPHPNTSNDQLSFSYLGLPAPAGTSDWYESMSRTPFRDGQFPPLVPSYPRPRIVILAIKSIPRTPIRGGNPEDGLWVAQMTLERLPQPAPPIFTTSCAGGSRHGRLL